MPGFLAETVIPSKQLSSLLEGFAHFTGILQRGSTKHGGVGAHGGGHTGWHVGWHGEHAGGQHTGLHTGGHAGGQG